MLYKHLDNFFSEGNYIVNEEELRYELYRQTLDDLEFNEEEYFKETGPFELSKMLDIFKIAIYGSIDDVIKTFEQIWGDTIIKVDEEDEKDEDELELCPDCRKENKI